MANNSVNGVNLNKKGLQMLTYDAPTDEELYAQANLVAEEEYKSDFDRIFNQTKRKKDVMSQAIRDAQSDYTTATKAMAQEYESSAKTLSQEALARGLGRSSYALDLQSENQSDKQQSLAALMQDKMQAVNYIQNRIDMLEQEFIDNQTYLSGKKQDEIQSALADLKQERDDTLRDVLEYNNELIMDQKEFALKKLKADRAYAVKVAKANSGTRSRSSSASSRTASESLMETYTELSNASKLKFFNENQEAMKKDLDIDTYKNVLREIYAFIEQGILPETNA